MATANTAERNARANDWATRYAGAVLQIRAGTTVLASHTLAGFGAAASGSVTANAIADATIGNGGGTADNAKLIDGSNEYDLTLGTSGDTPTPDVIVSTTNYIDGETSSINSLVVTFPA